MVYGAARVQAVVAINVDTVERPIGIFAGPVAGVGRAMTHIGEEILEGIEPPTADRDTSPSVVLEAMEVRISTSLIHVLPQSVFGRPGKAVSFSVGVA